MSLQIVPSIDLRSGKVVRLQQGDYARQIDYPADAEEVAKLYEQAGAKWLHLVDLDGAKEGRVAQAELIGKIVKSSNMTVQAGGGIRSTADIDQLLTAGVSRVVVGTAALKDWAWFEALVSNPAYFNKLVLAIDAKDGMVATHAWQSTSGVSALELAKRVSGWPLAALLYTDVAKDGMLSGPNVEKTAELAKASTVPVIASGGVGNVSHVESLLGMGIWGVIIGRALFEGKFKLEEALGVANNR